MRGKSWGMLLLAAVSYAWQALPAEFTANVVDNPELLGLLTRRALLNLTALASLVCVMVWIWQPRYGGRMFVLCCMPLTSSIAAIAVNDKLRENRHPDGFDKAGIFVRHYLSPEQTDHLAIVGDNHGGLFKIKYYTDNLKPQLVLQAAGQQLSAQSLPPGTRWVLATGKRRTMPGLLHLQTADFSLSNLLPNDGSRYHLDFGQNERNGYLRSSDGLSEVGGTGRWSLQQAVRMEFVKPLPPQLRLTVNVNGFGPNVGKDLIVQVGDERQAFKLGASPAQGTLQFKNGGGIDSLRILAPQPTSPKQLGQSGDDRTLGFFLIGMTISSSDPAVRAELENDRSPLQF